MKTQNITYKVILAEELAKRTEKNPRYSLRAMAKALDIEASALSEILSVKRVPSLKMAERMLKNLDLPPDQKEKFLISIIRHRQDAGLKVPREMRTPPLYSRQGTETDSPHQTKDLSIDLFRIIGDWHHYAILMLTYVKDFQSRPKWIATQLSISEIEAKLAIERLLELELLKWQGERLVSWNSHFTTSDKTVTTAALKRRQKQILEKSVYSLENDPIEERSHTAMTMAIDTKKIPEAKKFIEEFTSKMSTLLETGHQDRVYEFHVGLFPLQKKNS